MTNSTHNDLKKFLMKTLQESNNRQQHLYDLLEKLDYKKVNSITIQQMDAFLIKAVHDCLGTDDIHHDMVLMAFGLLKGFDYETMPSDTERRRNFLLKTDYLVRNTRSESSDFSAAGIDTQKRLIDSLRQTEPRWVSKVAKHLQKQKDIEKYVDEIDDYVEKNVKGKIISVNLPDPRFPKGSGMEYNIKLILREVVAIKKNTSWLGLKLGAAGILSIFVVVASTSIASYLSPDAQETTLSYIPIVPLSPMKDSQGLIDETRRGATNNRRVILTNEDEIVDQSLDAYWGMDKDSR